MGWASRQRAAKDEDILSKNPAKKPLAYKPLHKNQERSQLSPETFLDLS